MGEISLDYYCRLCLKESFSLDNIYSSHSPSGDLMYRALNFVYDLQICPDDGLPPKICSPCTWKMLEFNTYKENVHFAKAEILKLLKEKSADSIGDCSSREYNGTSMESDSTHSVQSNEEIEEWQMPEELKREAMDIEGYGIESVLHTNGNIVNVDHGSASSEVVPMKEEIDIVEWQMPEDLKVRAMDIEDVVAEVQDIRHVDNADDEEELVKTEAAESEEGINERISSVQLTKSSQLPEVPNSDCNDIAGRTCLGESSSVNTAQDNNVRIRHTNKRTSEQDLRDDVVQAQESLSAEEPKSFLNDTEAGPSHLFSPLSNMKNKFKCDICKKGFFFKVRLGNHVRVHYDDRLFNCGVCCKSFKQESVRYQHELGHLKDTMSVGKSEKRSMKKPFSCGICGRNFGSKNGLKGHCNQHSEKYSCRMCGKSYGNNADLKKHLRVHTKEKPYECKNCFKSFNVKANLSRHMVSHSSDKPFACDVCKKTFKTKESKKRHELVHLKKK